ncbi:hypothetical protein Daesc_000398 [Daldinia eschscholtzii]|uniref:Uncharacterized protein n=1 Tax=Daldinia eschscholtzii TaxID=292717 RepID=A0AAX6MZI5_9PEZI
MAYNSADVIRIELEDHKSNLTALQTVIAPSWVSAQGIRGTSDILWSCILTLTACIYTSLHLDIGRESGWKQRLQRKAKWVIIAILAPEIVVFMAFSQLLKARQLVKKLNMEREIRKKKGENNVCPEFDLRYGFFVIMGGLQVSYSDIANEDKTCNPWTIPRDEQEDYWSEPGHIKTLSARAVVALAEQGEFLYVPQENTDDKSKADAVQKTLVVLQVSWMVTQCIVRKVYGLPLTLLEIHTMVHVVCALILYVCWFEKPLDVRNPDIISRSNSSNRRDNFFKLLLFEDAARAHTDYRIIQFFTPLVDEYGAERQDISPKDVEAEFRQSPIVSLRMNDILIVRRLNDEVLPSYLQPENITPFRLRFSLICHGGNSLEISRKDYLMAQKTLAAITEIKGSKVDQRALYHPILDTSYEYHSEFFMHKNTSNLQIKKITSQIVYPAPIILKALIFKQAPLLLKLAIFLFPVLYGVDLEDLMLHHYWDTPAIWNRLQDYDLNKNV